MNNTGGVPGDSRRDTESSTQSYGGRSDSLNDIENSSSTVSGTTVTEEGWESGEGSIPEGAHAPNLARGAGREAGGGSRYGSAPPAAVAAAASRKRTSFHRVLDSARCELLLCLSESALSNSRSSL